MEIIGYTYKADIYCPECIVSRLPAEVLSPAAWGMRTEDVLDQVAAYDGIDRYDEYSYDSGDFPKVVFFSEGESCGSCGADL